jgi:hypothetical protein
MSDIFTSFEIPFKDYKKGSDQIINSIKQNLENIEPLSLLQPKNHKGSTKKSFVKRISCDIVITPDSILFNEKSKIRKIWKKDIDDVECPECLGFGNKEVIAYYPIGSFEQTGRIELNICKECNGLGRVNLKPPLDYSTDSISKEKLQEILEKDKKIDLLMSFPPASSFIEILEKLSKIFPFDMEEEDTDSDCFDIFLCGEEYCFDWKHLHPDQVKDVSLLLSEEIGCTLVYGRNDIKRTTMNNKKTRYSDFFHVLSISMNK